ncbi:MAG TPA: hypothetical protein PK992_19410 [Planctomycetaceae bacterium]|nr:hypothetical protein [Planctomycetaceae bacterium]
MPLHPWSERNEWLNALYTAILQRTHGLISDLSLDLIDDGSAVVRGMSPSYYGVQLVLHTTKMFAEKHRVFAKTRLLLTVGGSTLELIVTRPDDDDHDDDDDDSVSTHDDNCRQKLTIAEVA